MTKQQRLVLWISILASFIAFLDGSVINVALPAITNELGGGLSVQQWVVDAYLITLGSLMLIAGSFSDLFGRKRIISIGLIGFAATSLLCALAPTSEFLIVSRGLQGIAGALLVPSSLALIISAFSGPGQGKAIGSWTAWTGIAFIIGPLLGGFFVDSASWRLVFAINILPVAVTLWLLKILNMPDAKPKNVKVDYLGAVLCAIGLGGPVYALIEQSHYGWSNPIIYLPLIFGLLALGLFIWQEKRSSHPMMPLALFKVRNFSAGNFATVAIYGAISIISFLLTVFLQQTGGYSAIYAGMAFLPVTMMMFVLSPRFGALAGKYGPRLFMTVGPVVAGIGFILMHSIQLPLNYWTDLFPAVMLFGLGLAITVAPLTSAVLGSIHKDQAGTGSAINNAIARVAGLIGIATIGLITGSVLDIDGFRRGIIATAALMIAGGVISAVGIRNIKPKIKI